MLCICLTFTTFIFKKIYRFKIYSAKWNFFVFVLRSSFSYLYRGPTMLHHPLLRSRINTSFTVLSQFGFALLNKSLSFFQDMMEWTSIPLFFKLPILYFLLLYFVTCSSDEKSKAILCLILNFYLIMSKFGKFY
jgi:hypothetical protein